MSFYGFCSSDYFPGLGEYLDLSPVQLIEQVQTVRAGGPNGAIVFQLGSMEDETLECLGCGVYRMKAITPFRSASDQYSAILANLIGNIRRLFPKNAGISLNAQKDILRNIYKLPKSLDPDERRLRGARRRIDKLLKVTKSHAEKGNIKKPVLDQIIKDLESLKSLVQME